jgi:hypothetical protein
VIFAAITEKATTVLSDLDEPVLALHETLMGHLSQAELKELSRLLEKVREPLIKEE